MTEPDLTINLGPDRPEDVRCDFCHVGLNRCTVWIYPCETFTPSVFQSPGLTQSSIGDWAACEDCHSLVEQKAWDTLAKRSMERDPIPGLSRSQRRQAMKHLKQLYLEFQQHRTGPPYQMPAIG